MSPYVLEPEGSGASLASMGIATAVWLGVTDFSGHQSAPKDATR